MTGTKYTGSTLHCSRPWTDPSGDYQLILYSSVPKGNLKNQYCTANEKQMHIHKLSSISIKGLELPLLRDLTNGTKLLHLSC